MLKKSALCALLWCAALLFGAPDPADPAGWLIAEAYKKDTSFDVFYLHPTLLSDKKNPYPDFGNPEVRARLVYFSAAQTALFGKEARIFVPAVRQLEFKRCLQEMKRTSSPRIMEDSPRFAAVQDAIAAFRHYLARWNGGRPYVLLGHSQGAADLYEVLCRVPEISPDRGFAAAYLPGLAGLTEEQMKKDLAGRGIFPAQDEGSPGVVVIWNTRLPGGKKDPFTIPGS